MILNSILVVALFFIEINELIYTEEEDESQIAGTPSELQAFANHDSIQVSWLPPREDNVLIRGFQIGWGINIPDIEKTIVDSNVRQYTIRNLKPNREYVISLRAFNKKGQGFPIYETVKTYSSSSLTTLSPNIFIENIHAPVGLFAETLSASQIHLYWTDPNDEAFNQYYTIKYAMSGEADGLAKEINTSETDYLFDNLRPDTQYEFAVKIARTNHWSLIAINRTFPAPPSSPPRDITLVGFGPFTPITSFLTPEILDISSISDKNNKFADDFNSTFSQQIVQLLSKNLTNVFLGIVTIVLLVLVVAVIVACTCRKPRRQTNVKHPQYSYIPGRKYSQQTGDNLWIQQNGTRFAAVLDNSGTLGRTVCENFEMPTSSGEERRILLVDRQQRAFITSNAHAHFGSPSPQYNSQYLPPSDGQGVERLGNGFYNSKLHRRLADSVQSVDEHQPPSKSKKIGRQNRSSLPPRFCSSASITPLAVKSNKIGQNYLGSPTSTGDLYPVWTRQTNEGNNAFSNNDCDYSPLRHQRHFVDTTTESLIPSFGIPALPVKLARRTLITEHSNGFYNDRPKMSTKCVNFAPILDTSQSDLNETENKDDDIVQNTFHEGQDRNLSRNCYNTAIISPHGRNLGHPTPNSTPRNPHVVHTRTDRQHVKVDLAVGNQRTGAFSSEELIDNDRSASKVHPSSISNHHIMELEEQRQQPKVAHVVRPIAAIKAANASPSAFRNVCSSNKPKTSPLMSRNVPNGNVPIGRAMVQRRVNITNQIETSASPYSSIRVQRECESEDVSTLNVRQQIQPQCNNKIDTLQQLQHEFTQAEDD
uniref:Fibronectin type-III domain-containing protein n=1 Tax=Meloidogyne javanica TaxID=6303 RepID=A0A915MNH3_MELJA